MKQADNYDLADYVLTAAPVKGKVQESDVRLARARLTALERSRFLKGGDRRADVLEAFLVGERALTLQDVLVADADPGWLEKHLVPESVERVTVLVEAGFIPIFAGGRPETLDAEMAQQILDYGAELPSAESKAWRTELQAIVDSAPPATWRGQAPLTGVPVSVPAPDYEVVK